jgi:hypothetical protein
MTKMNKDPLEDQIEEAREATVELLRIAGKISLILEDWICES